MTVHDLGTFSVSALSNTSMILAIRQCTESIVIAMISYLHLCGLLRHNSTGRTRFVNVIVLAAGGNQVDGLPPVL